MPVLSLPLTFNNSFWTQDYRKGLEIVHAKLVQGVEEDSQIISFIRARAANERIFAASLRSPTLNGPPGTGFEQDDGASLLVAFRGLEAESVKQGEIHRTIAHELETIVADPFSDWADRHSLRVEDSKKTILDGWLRQYEEDIYEVDKLKNSYLAKRQRADELEDDAKFAPNSDAKRSYTSSLPQPQRAMSLSDRFGQRLRIAPPSTAHAEPVEVFDASKSEAELSEAETVRPDSPIKKLDKGKGKAVDPLLSPPRSGSRPSVVIPSTPPQPESVLPSEPVVLLAGLAFSGAALPNLLKRAKAELPLRPVRFPILGEYEDTFTGEDFTTWLKNNVPGFDGSLDRAETAARELTERDNLIKKIGEIGNKFENHPAALYQFRSKAFEPLTVVHAGSGKPGSIGNIQEYLSPVSLSPVVNFPPRRSNTFKSFLNTFNSPTVEPVYVKARAEANASNERYRKAVRALDRQRVALEDKIESSLKLWNRWELDRLRAVKTVLLQYQGTLANSPSAYGPSLERSATLIESYQPEADLLMTIERYRTGPFRPVAQVYKSAETGQTDVVFGIDLRRWAGDESWQSVRSGTSGPAAMGIPPVVKGLLEGLKASYPKLSGNAERRKAWIYDVPLQSQHALREVLNGLPKDSPLPLHIFEKYDTPVLAGTLKLWLLELDPPLALWEGWDEIRKLYPSIGVDSAKGRNIVEELRQTLGHWPMVHLLVLDAVVSHLKELVESTTNDAEPTEVYVNKLALSVGRAILRPKLENQYSIQDRHPTVFFIDLINKYTEVLPPTIAHKKRESGRSVPSRKRTVLVDMRVHRSSLSAEIDPLLIREAHADVQRSRSRASSPAPGEQRGIRPLSLVGGTGPRSRASSPVAGERTPRPISAQLSDLPPRPQFKEPEPEPEEIGLVPSGASVIVVPPSPLDHAPPQLGAFSLTFPHAPPASAPPVTTPSAPVPTEETRVPTEPAVTAAPVPVPAPAPARVAEDSVIKESSPPSSIVSATSSSRASSPTKASGSPTASSPSSTASPSARRGSGASLQRAGSTDGGAGGVRGPRAPRIMRGPRVANPAAATTAAAAAVGGGTGLNASATVALSSGSKTASSRSLSDRTSPPRNTPSPSGSASGASKTTSKRARPTSAILAGHLATRTMASDSEADIVG